MAAIEAMTMTQSVEALLSVIYRDQTFEKVLYGDSASAIIVFSKIQTGLGEPAICGYERIAFGKD